MCFLEESIRLLNAVKHYYCLPMKKWLCFLLLGMGCGFALDSTQFQRWGALPVLGYTEETELQLGALVLWFFQPSIPDGEGSSLDFALYGTTRNQWVFTLGPKWRFLEERLVLDANLDYKKWPANYFGMGNQTDKELYNTYTMTQWRLRAPFETNLGLPHHLSRYFLYGAELDVEHNHTEFDSIQQPQIGLPDKSGGLRTGLGYNIQYNTTDHENWPRNGVLVKWRHMRFPQALGDWSFGWKSLDIRTYLPMDFLKEGALALCSFWEGVDGEVPFDRLAQPDGVRHLRGLEKGMYRDRQAWVLHSELRTQLFWRLGGTLFYESGKVGPYASALFRNEWHHVVGAGARLAINQSKRLNARADVSWVDGKKLGLTVYLREAF